MIICKNCGVELEEDMLTCPLCGEPVSADGKNPLPGSHHYVRQSRGMSHPQKKFTWEIVSLILLSGIMATLIIDYILNKQIKWSEYPVAIALTIFSYVSLFAFWRQRTIIQMVAGLILSSLFMLLLDAIKGNTGWSFKLGIPLLFAGNIVAAALIAVIRSSKYKGINLLAYAFIAAALLCICIDGILSSFKSGSIGFRWSIIVAGSIIPVVLVLLFAYFKLKKGRSLVKTFHI
ncbi:MAG TPA: DUF6320 domain-containing protein [Chitinophagaceae bacterium]|nr:DUF6320 domain-containing protein [Chitinophagaceae bacterium]